MKKSNKMWHKKDLPEYIHKKITVYQQLPKVFADRIQKMSILSFFILLFGIFMGMQMKSAGFIFWSVVLGVITFWQAVRLLHTAQMKKYEIVEGKVLKVSDQMPFGRLKRIKLGFPDGGETVLLLEKSIFVEVGTQYRFYFNSQSKNLSGIRTVDAIWDTGSFYGYEKISQG